VEHNDTENPIIKPIICRVAAVVLTHVEFNGCWARVVAQNGEKMLLLSIRIVKSVVDCVHVQAAFHVL